MDGFAVLVALEEKLRRERDEDRAFLGRLDPRLIDASKCVAYNANLLRDALVMCGPFVRPNGCAHRSPSVVRIYDGVAGGTLYAASGSDQFTFECDVFAGKPTCIPAQSVSDLARFLRSSGREVELRSDATTTFAVSRVGVARVMSWPNCSPPKEIASAGGRTEVILCVLTRPLIDALRHVGKAKASVRMAYDAASAMVRLSVADDATGAAVRVLAHPETPEDRDFALDADAGTLMKLLKRTRCGEVELRLSHVGDPGESAALTTVDEFWVDADTRVIGGGPGFKPIPANGPVFRCRVTRSTIVRVGSKTAAAMHSTAEDGAPVLDEHKNPEPPSSPVERRRSSKTDDEESCPLDVRALPLNDWTFGRVAPRLLKLMTNTRKEGWSASILARSMRVTPAAVVVVARQLDIVLDVRGRRNGPRVSVRAGCAEQLAVLEDRIRREVGRARRQAKGAASAASSKASKDEPREETGEKIAVEEPPASLLAPPSAVAAPVEPSAAEDCPASEPPSVQEVAHAPEPGLWTQVEDISPAKSVTSTATSGTSAKLSTGVAF